MPARPYHSCFAQVTLAAGTKACSIQDLSAGTHVTHRPNSIFLSDLMTTVSNLSCQHAELRFVNNGNLLVKLGKKAYSVTGTITSS
jgi:pSer/pThr/pTyr-binding forkhead associated (FHA) protein